MGRVCFVGSKPKPESVGQQEGHGNGIEPPRFWAFRQRTSTPARSSPSVPAGLGNEGVFQDATLKVKGQPWARGEWAGSGARTGRGWSEQTRNVAWNQPNSFLTSLSRIQGKGRNNLRLEGLAKRGRRKRARPVLRSTNEATIFPRINRYKN